MTDKNHRNPPPLIHDGNERSSPYPTSRLAPAFSGGDLVEEVARAESMLSARTGAKLRVIADQIRALQQEARKVLDEARQEQALNQARCAFKRIPGKIYHLYRARRGAESYFSMLSPEDWNGRPPDEHLGAFRLESDYSWTPESGLGREDETGAMVQQLLRIGGLGDT